MNEENDQRKGRDFNQLKSRGVVIIKEVPINLEGDTSDIHHSIFLMPMI